MSAPINLNKVRKAKAAVNKRLQADENAVKHGRSKAERILEATMNRNVQNSLDRHKIEEE